MEFTRTRLMIDKPECKICKKENNLQDLAQDMLYSLFNPYYKERGNFDLSELLRKYLQNEEIPLRDFTRNLGLYSSYWMRNFEKFREMKKRAWEELKGMLEKREINREDLSMSQLVELFFEEVVEELERMGYVESYEGKFYRKSVRYKAIAEKMIGDKILSIVLENLERRKVGEEMTEMEGTSIFVSEKLVEFDENLHTFDNIDIIETFVNSALRKKDDFEELVARQSKHAEKCSYVMLIDVSDSMRGKKIIGAIEAGIALKRTIKRRGSGELEIIAFNHKVSKVKGSEILNLEPRGRTDIGLALKMAGEILSGKTGNRVVFLISDGEPTSSYNSQLTPWLCALKEARMLRNINAKLHIVMFGNEKRFVDLCNSMAKLCGRSSVFHFSDPLNLKKYILHRF
ncbi:MAG: VWA domain-containing protein [Archaeoglobaceae archaeon]|nr:VWA domain-containing protein [Archaeoglobaceae archaeon]MDW7989074.1 VWA domain-containing protein [Archaeoglobaceae archaeon]